MFMAIYKTSVRGLINHGDSPLTSPGMILQVVNKLIQIHTKPPVLGVNKSVVRKDNAKNNSNMTRRFNKKNIVRLFLKIFCFGIF